MDFTGKLANISVDWKTGQPIVSFTVNEASAMNQIENIQNVEKLSIKAVKYRQKRSLDANAYFHVLVGKIAESLTISKAHAKNLMIGKYGQVQTLPDGSAMIYKSNAPVEYMQELEALHSMPVKFSEENGKEVVFYRIYRGSSTYDSKEMSLLIEGTVSDAKDLGIETIPPDELERMMLMWGKKHEKAV